MLKEQFTHWCSQLQQVTTVKRWRSLIVIAGDENWTAQHRDASLGLLLSIENQCKQRQGLVYGDVAITSHFTQLSSVNRKNYSQYLGTEQNVIVFSVQANVDNNEIDFDVDAFAALSGTLVAGGVFLLLLTPIIALGRAPAEEPLRAKSSSKTFSESDSNTCFASKASWSNLISSSIISC